MAGFASNIYFITGLLLDTYTSFKADRSNNVYLQSKIKQDKVVKANMKRLIIGNLEKGLQNTISY